MKRRIIIIWKWASQVKSDKDIYENEPISYFLKKGTSSFKIPIFHDGQVADNMDISGFTKNNKVWSKTNPVADPVLDSTSVYDDDDILAKCIYNNDDAVNNTALGLHALQHRGSESSGIVVSDSNELLSLSVSSTRRTSSAPFFFAIRWFKIAVLAFPMCKSPVGLGANRTRIIVSSVVLNLIVVDIGGCLTAYNLFCIPLNSVYHLLYFFNGFIGVQYLVTSHTLK